LSDAELGALNVLGQRRRIARGETLMWAGDDSLVCANLLSGVLKITDTTADGREQIVGLLYPADFVGRPFADSADFTVTALTDATLCVFPRLPFERVLEDHVRMERLLLQRTFAALGEARRRMLVLARKSAREKVAGFLLDMADRAGDAGCRAAADGPVTFDLPMTRGQIAAVLGLTIETVSRQFTALKTAGLIALPTARAVTIRDRAGLAAKAEAGRRIATSRTA
jgi:CRP/FNR family transcriptional regulator